jgi:hypothetical protein
MGDQKRLYMQRNRCANEAFEAAKKLEGDGYPYPVIHLQKIV